MGRRRHHGPAHPEDSFSRLQDLLHAEAERHEPDSERIWAQIEAAMGAPSPEAAERPGQGKARGSRWRPPRLRLVIAPLAAVAAAGIVSGVVWTSDRGGTATVQSADRGTDLRRSPSAPARPAPADGTVRGTPAPAPSRSGAVPMTTPEAWNGLFSVAAAPDAHSNEYWAQNNLTVQVRRELREFTVTVRVARTERVQPTGSWLSLPSADFQIATETSGDAVVYRWTLRSGRTVRPGAYTLAAQYNRTSGHDPRKDTYSVRGAGSSGRSVAANGHF